MWGDWDGDWRIRVGVHRMVYEIVDAAELVLIARVGHRRDVYERP